jgi:hypothetical protein
LIIDILLLLLLLLLFYLGLVHRADIGSVTNVSGILAACLSAMKMPGVVYLQNAIGVNPYTQNSNPKT